MNVIGEPVDECGPIGAVFVLLLVMPAVSQVHLK